MSFKIEYVRCANEECNLSHPKRIKLTIPNPHSKPKYFCSLTCLTKHYWITKKEFNVLGLNEKEYNLLMDMLATIKKEKLE